MDVCITMYRLRNGMEWVERGRIRLRGREGGGLGVSEVGLRVMVDRWIV